MKKSLVILGIIILAVLCWLFIPKLKVPADDRTAAPSDQSATVAERDLNLPQSTPLVTNPASTGRTVKAAGDIREAARSFNVPIKFWGKVVDQDGRPLQGVAVQASARQWGFDALPPLESALLQPSFKKINAVTDEDGLFQVTGEMGDILRVHALQKEGYAASSGQLRSFGYNISTNITPDPLAPILFKMWKRGTLEPLVVHRLSRNGIPCDGTPVSFDLVAGMKGGQGKDLVVTFLRDPVNLANAEDKFDWVATFEIPDGGLIESDDEFMFKAPESGYQRSFRVSMNKDASTWKRSLKTRFYVTLRSGTLFGSLDVNLSAFYQTSPTGLTMDVVINPTGSKSLEK